MPDVLSVPDVVSVPDVLLGSWSRSYDAGVSMRSIHDPATRTTATVLANTSEGAWGVAGELLRMFD